MENAQESNPHIAELRSVIRGRYATFTDAARAAGIKRATLSSICNSKKEGIDHIGLGLKYRIWKEFQLECFYSEYFEPIDRQKDDLRTQLMKYIVINYNGSIDNFEKKQGFGRTTIRRFLDKENRQLKQESAKKIEQILAERKNTEVVGESQGGRGLSSGEEQGFKRKQKFMPEEAPIKQGNLSLEETVDHAEHLLYALNYALEELRYHEKSREQLASRFNPKDIGALTCYLLGLYSDNELIPPNTTKLPTGRKK